jgi:hypothetical protein
MSFIISGHARQEMLRRSISLEHLETVLQSPQQIIPVRSGRKVYQSRIDFGGGKIFLLRAIVDDTIESAVVITVYRTTKINKYWRSP